MLGPWGWWAAFSSWPTRCALPCPRRALQLGPAALNITYVADAYAGINYTAAMNPSLVLPPYLAFSTFKQPVGRDRTAQETFMK